MSAAKNSCQWYARRDGVIRGPFTVQVVTRHILLGRIRLDDELSDDRVTWQAAGSVVSLLPEEIGQLSSWGDYQRLVVARIQVDERRQERRKQPATDTPPADGERRSGIERRSAEGAHSIARLAYDRGLGNARRHGIPARTGLLLAVVIAAGVLAIWLLPVAGS